MWCAKEGKCLQEVSVPPCVTCVYKRDEDRQDRRQEMVVGIDSVCSTPTSTAHPTQGGDVCRQVCRCKAETAQFQREEIGKGEREREREGEEVGREKKEMGISST